MRNQPYIPLDAEEHRDRLKSSFNLSSDLPIKKTSFLQYLGYIGNISKLTVGVGALTLPYIFKKLHFWLGLTIYFSVIAFALFAFSLILKLADETNFKG